MTNGTRMQSGLLEQWTPKSAADTIKKEKVCKLKLQ